MPGSSVITCPAEAQRLIRQGYELKEVKTVNGQCSWLVVRDPRPKAFEFLGHWEFEQLTPPEQQRYIARAKAELGCN